MKTNRTMTTIAIILSILTLGIAGCATVFSGSTQRINVQAIDSQSNRSIPSAHCSLMDGQGNTYPVTGNPGSVVVTRGKGSMQVRCAARGYRQGRIGVGQSFNAWSVVNVLFWPGVIVDACTGAIQKYPSHITVMMNKAG